MPRSAPPTTLKSLQIISAGMLAGVLFFLAVVLFVRPGMAGNLDVVGYLAAGWAVLSLPLASVLRSAKWPSTTPDHDPDYWRKRGAAHIVSIGILEGASFFCCVALMVSKEWWPLAALLVPMGGMVAWFPREP